MIDYEQLQISTISMGNSAFTDDPQQELARILRKLADAIEKDYRTDGVLMDINGNRVGDWEII